MPDIVQKFGVPANQANDVASATATDLGGANGDFVNITGTVTITSFTAAPAGVRREVKFTASLTLTHNATNLILPNASNIVTAANDTAKFVSLGSGNWLCLGYKHQAAKYTSSTVLQGAAVSLTNDTAANITSISLLPGKYLVWGLIGFASGATTTCNNLWAWISTTSATPPTAPNNGALLYTENAQSVGADHQYPIGMIMLDLLVTTTVYLSGRSSFGVSTMGGFGFLGAYLLPE